jgi:hypothetical protein
VGSIILNTYEGSSGIGLTATAVAADKQPVDVLITVILKVPGLRLLNVAAD